MDDEPLDGSTETNLLVGGGSLLAALNERRDGRMNPAAATLQREQDDIVRSEVHGPLVVQGGPGTGKTVVALHRVAYLLFSRPQLSAQGVLVLGPSARFLDYIAQVLPALGETAVVSATCDSLIPGVRVEREDDRDVAAIKGQLLWDEGLTAYGETFLPAADRMRLLWDGEHYDIAQSQIERSLRYAKTGRNQHRARRMFFNSVHDLLADAVVARSEELLAQSEEGFEDILGNVDAVLARADTRAAHSGAAGAEIDGVLSEEDVEELRERIANDSALRRSLEQWWPVADPKERLRTLLTSPELLGRYLPHLTKAEKAVVAGQPSGWASSDIPLLDKLFDLVGEAPDERQSAAEFLSGRAAGRRDWVYGHVVVDEAQELSEMQWQMVVRRCPSRSVTAVGDIDQTEAPHRQSTWGEAVGGVFGERWTEARLTICYRTPREVMELTRPVLRAAGSRNDPPVAVRSSGFAPWSRRVPEESLVPDLARAVSEMQDRWAGGSVGVVAPRSRVHDLRAAFPGVTVLDSSEAKGLEWDAAVVVDAAGIAAEPRGWNGLYVALTRCTQELAQFEVA